jgi:hypothetical protein
MVSDVRRIVEEGPIGVRTIEKFVQACLQGAASGDPEAVGLFVFAKLAEPFSDYYADQALSEARATEFRSRLVSALASYEDATTPEARQGVLHQAIRDFLGDAAT